ncbi:MAG: M24 family metallopeptidase [Candidatus Hodarchaeota archaeon]
MDLKLAQAKNQQASDLLKELDLDTWIIWVRETKQMADPALSLILGIDLVWQSALIYTKTGKRIAIVGNFDAAGIQPLQIFDEIIPYTQSIRESLRQELNRLKPKRIALNFSRDDVASDGITFGMYNLLTEYLQGTPYPQRFESAESLLSLLRGRKTPEELNRITQAIKITERIFEEAHQFLRIDQTELDIYRFFHERLEAHGVGLAWGADHNPAVDAGPNKQFGHAGPTDNKTKAGHLLHFDFGVRYQGYCSDLQRMFFFGNPQDIPEEIQSAFNTVRDAIQTASEFIKPGVKGHEVDAIARTYVKDQGYQEYQHALGHQIGQQAHDGGTILGPLWDRYGSSPQGLLEAGNVFTLELYVTTKNYGQVSLEENIVVTKTGCQFLSNPQTQLLCVRLK